MFILGIDLETTGLDPKTDKIIEVGAVVWDTKEKKPLRMLSELVQVEQKLEPEIVRITGITDSDLEAFGLSLEVVLQRLADLTRYCDYVVAHNGRAFDKLFLDRDLAAHGLAIDLPWIDTLHDVPYDDHINTRNLTHLCADHQFLNPFCHRAVFDVLSMLKVMSQYSFEHVEDLYKSPQRRLIAKVSYDERELAKKAGFRWDPSQKCWYRDVKECQISQFSFTFPTDML